MELAAPASTSGQLEEPRREGHCPGLGPGNGSVSPFTVSSNEGVRLDKDEADLGRAMNQDAQRAWVSYLPQKAKWRCLQGIVGCLGIVAQFRELRTPYCGILCSKN